MAKGQQFERDICRQLSLWFSKGKHDDWFWRSSNSGGRATVRSKKGKKTVGQYGDIAATDPRGIPLLKFFCFELKRGYNREANFHDLIDGVSSIWLDWIAKAKKNARESKSKTWAIIHKRDRKDAVIIMPTKHMPMGMEECVIHWLNISIVTLKNFFDIHPQTYMGDQ